MKAYYFALALLAIVASASAQCGPDETECPAGCCPEANWFCCPDNEYCAATADDCPSYFPFSLVKPLKGDCGPDETECPAGCCPEANWFCCPDNRYCAATANDCPAVRPAVKKVKAVRTRIVKTRCDPVTETECPAGCCPEVDWFCCADNRHCAATEENCPNYHPASLVKPLKGVNTKTTDCGPDETECPGGCCPEANWFCCPDNRYCAATADDCPAYHPFSLVKPIKTGCGPDETECPAGCCPEANWFCCKDNEYCAATEADCPAVKAVRTRIVKTRCDPVTETECPAGCCPEANWFCCADNRHCAATETDCPNYHPASLVKPLEGVNTKTTDCGPDETECPGGCCPEANWFCCPDNRYCAATADDCPAYSPFKPLK